MPVPQITPLHLGDSIPAFTYHDVDFYGKLPGGRLDNMLLGGVRAVDGKLQRATSAVAMLHKLPLASRMYGSLTDPTGNNITRRLTVTPYTFEEPHNDYKAGRLLRLTVSMASTVCVTSHWASLVREIIKTSRPFGDADPRTFFSSGYDGAIWTVTAKGLPPHDDLVAVLATGTFLSGHPAGDTEFADVPPSLVNTVLAEIVFDVLCPG